MLPEFQLLHARWEDCRRELGEVRRAVFVEEQGVPESLEWDGLDADCFHVLVCDAEQQPVATGRMKPDGHIGRMAVLPAYRGQGVGSAVLEALLDVARQQHYAEVFLHAQVSAIAFYERHGFVVYGAEFMDAGISHKSMRRQTGSRADR
jgi:predicted GNAT family N-acyltransferase